MGWLGRRLAVYGTVLLVATGFAACSADEPPSRLRVTITGADGRVVVSGPEGSRTFERDGDWTVRPGRYEVRIEPVRAGDATVRPTDLQQTVTVRQGATTQVRAEYRIEVPDRTKIADGGEVLGTTDTEVVLAAGTYATALRPGHLIVSGATRSVPQAFAARVDAVRAGPDGTTVATVVEVPMVLALPRMVIRIEPTPAPRADVDIFPGPPSVDGEAWTEVPMDGPCTRGGPKLTYGLEPVESDVELTEIDLSVEKGKFDVDLWPPKADVDLPKIDVRVRFGATVSGTATIGIEAAAAFTCTSEADLPGVELKACRVAAKIVTVGHGDLTCKLNQRFEAAVTTAAGFELGAELDVRARLTGDLRLSAKKLPITIGTQNPLRGGKVWGQMAPVARGKATSEGTFSGGLLKTVGVSVGKGTAKLGLTLTEFMKFGADLTLDHLAGDVTVTRTFGTEYGAEVDVWGDRWDKTYKAVPLRFSLPIARWRFAEENRRLPRTPTGTVYYPVHDPVTYQTSLYAKEGTAPATVVAPELPGGAAVAPDGSSLAWVDLSADPATLMIGDLSGTGQPMAATANVGGLCNQPAWSPDGREVLFQKAARTSATSGEWSVLTVATGAVRSFEMPGCYPVWSPDGTAIAWYDDQAPEGHASIRITDASGGGARFVPAIDGVADPCSNAVVALSPGGDRILVDASAPDRHACGDGPGRGTAGAGLVVDTRTGTPVADVEPLRAGTFLADGTLLAVPVARPEFVMYDKALTETYRMTEPTAGGPVLAFVP